MGSLGMLMRWTQFTSHYFSHGSIARNQIQSTLITIFLFPSSSQPSSVKFVKPCVSYSGLQLDFSNFLHKNYPKFSKLLRTDHWNSTFVFKRSCLDLFFIVVFTSGDVSCTAGPTGWYLRLPSRLGKIISTNTSVAWIRKFAGNRILKKDTRKDDR